MTKLIALALIVVALTGCQQRAVDSAIDRSTAPVLVPLGDFRSDFAFTAPPGSTDLYQFRWNFRAGATDIVAGWQINPTSSSGTSMAEGAGQAMVEEARQAARGEGCTTASPEVKLCTFPAEFARGGVNAYLVRSLGDHTLVVDYLNLDGERTDYKPDSLEAQFITADFELIPIDGNIDDYLTTFR